MKLWRDITPEWIECKLLFYIIQRWTIQIKSTNFKAWLNQREVKFWKWWASLGNGGLNLDEKLI